MNSHKLFVNMDIQGQFTCLKEDYGRIQFQLKTGCAPDQSVLELMSLFLNQCVIENVDGLVLERRRLTDRDIPVLLCYPEKARQLPAVVFQHGFDARKETDLHYGIKFAKEGYFVILPDARLHGERKPADFNPVDQDFQSQFIRIVRGTSEDIAAILDELAGDDRVDVTQAGMVGVSMGGFIAFLAAAMDRRFRVAAPIIGSPDWRSSIGPPQIRSPWTPDPELESFMAEWEPLSHPELFFPKALLIQNGLEDQNVSFAGSRELHRKLQGLYSDSSEKIQLIEYPGVGHVVTEAMFRAALVWFKRYLL